MLRETSIPAASSDAAATPSATHDNEIIPVETGVTLIDADADLIARRLRRRSWIDRAQYLNNIIAHSILRQARMLDYARSEDAASAFARWALIEMRRRIGELLNLWNADRPADPNAAALFHLSLDPRHRRAAQAWMKVNEETPQSFVLYLQDQWVGLAALAELSVIGDADAAEAWRTGPRPCSDTWFNLPGWVA